MLTLIIDSSTDTFGAAILRHNRMLGEFTYSHPRKQLIYLTPEILNMLNIAGVSAQDISLIGVTSGPGSFTGLRLGLITAKTFAQILEIPVITINTLDAIAANLIGTKDIICSALDARKNEIFASFYRLNNEIPESISPYHTFNLEGFITVLKDYNEHIIITGNAIERYGEKIKQELENRVTMMPPCHWHPSAFAMFPLLTDKYRKGMQLKYNDVKAFYMRESDARENVRQRKAENGNV